MSSPTTMNKEFCKRDSLPLLETEVNQNYRSIVEKRNDQIEVDTYCLNEGKDFRTSATLTISLHEKLSDDRQASTLLTGWNVTNLAQGTGILAIPFAIQQGGWLAIIANFVVGLMSCHTGKLLIDCLYEDSSRLQRRKRVRASYSEIGRAAFPHFGSTLVNFMQSFEMFCAVVMFVVLLGNVLHGLFISLIPWFTTPMWATLSSLLCLPILFINRMSIVSYFGMISGVSLFISVLIMIISCLMKTNEWQWDKIPMFNPSTFPIGLGIIVFSYCAQPAFPGIENSMKEPKQFNTMIDRSFFIAALSKTLLGCFVVLTFGNETNEVATSNFRSNYAIYLICTSLALLNVFLLLPVVMFVVSFTFDELTLPYFPHLNNPKYQWLWILLTRPMLLLGALLVALIVPHFGLLMGFIGSFTGIFICFVLPCLFHLKLRWHKLSSLHIVFQICIIVFGLLCGMFGMYFSGEKLIKTYQSNG